MSRAPFKTTFDRTQIIQPFYTGGDVALSQDGRILATCLEEDVLLTDLRTGQVLSRIEGDGELITSLSLTPSASHVIACSRSLSMRIYSIDASEDGAIETTLLRTLKPHSAPVIVSAVDKTGTLLATGGADGVVKVWDIRGGYVTHTFHGHSGIISALLFFEVDPSAEGTGKNVAGRKRKANRHEVQETDEGSTAGFRLASGGEDGKVRIWNLLRRSTVAILDSHVSVVRGLDYCAEQNSLVSASRDQTAIIWDTKSWKIRNTIPVLEAVEVCGFLRGGSLTFTAGERGCIRLWTTANAEEITSEQESGTETEAILSVLVSDELPFILSVHADQTLAMHSLEPVTENSLTIPMPPLPILRRISGTHDEVIDLALIGRHGKYLALATNTEEVRIVSLESRQEVDDSDGSFTGPYFGSDITQLKAHDDIVIAIDIDPSGHWLATASKDNTARLWRVDPENDSFDCHAVFTGHAGALGGIAMPHSDPETADPLSRPPRWLVTGSQDRTVKRWEVPPYVPGKTETPGKAKYTRKAHDKEINALDVSYHSRDPVFASASQDKTVKIWDAESGEVLGVLRGHSRGVWAVRFSPLDSSILIQGAPYQGTAKGKGWVATGGGDRTVRIWSLVDYSCVATLEGHSNSVLKMVWLPSRSAAATSSTSNGDDAMDVDSVASKAQKAADKRTLVASAAADGLVKVWDLSIGECASTLDGHEDRVWGLAVLDPAKSAGTDSEYNPRFSTPTLISGGADAVLNFWADTSAATASAAAEREERVIEEDQELANLRYAGKLREAVGLAIAMERPSTLLSLFTEVLQKSTESTKISLHPESESMEVDTVTNGTHPLRRRMRKIGADTDNETLNAIMKELSDSQIFTLLLWLRDWNASARHADTAQQVLHAIVRNIPAERLANLHGRRAAGEEGNGIRRSKAQLKDVIAALSAYTERHIRRIDELQEETYLVDFTLGEMDEVRGG